MSDMGTCTKCREYSRKEKYAREQYYFSLHRQNPTWEDLKERRGLRAEFMEIQRAWSTHVQGVHQLALFPSDPV